MHVTEAEATPGEYFNRSTDRGAVCRTPYLFDVCQDLIDDGTIAEVTAYGHSAPWTLFQLYRHVTCIISRHLHPMIKARHL